MTVTEIRHDIELMTVEYAKQPRDAGVQSIVDRLLDEYALALEAEDPTWRHGGFPILINETN